MPSSHNTYTKAVWYPKHVTKEHADVCEIEPNVDVLLNRVTDAAVVLPPDNGPHYFDNYDDGKEDDN